MLNVHNHLAIQLKVTFEHDKPDICRKKCSSNATTKLLKKHIVGMMISFLWMQKTANKTLIVAF